MNINSLVSVKMLIDLGLLEPNTQLIWKKRSLGDAFSATVNADGSIRTTDGCVHKSLSGAARHVNAGKPIDGWNVWRVLENNQTLSELRSKAKHLGERNS
jgi:hypothetical protein